jgi:centromere protein S
VYDSGKVLTLAENVSHDLESFAEHAGRKTITTDDVMLLTRRNEGLESVMREFLDEQKSPEAEELQPKGNRRRPGMKGKGKR